MSLYLDPVLHVLNLLNLYLNVLTTHPVLTKSVTSAVVAVTGNWISQKIKARADKNTAGSSNFNYRSLTSFFVYGLLVIGPLSHYFYEVLELIVPASSSLVIVKRIVIDRLLFTPCLCLITVVTLDKLQGGSETIASIVKLRYLPTLQANWKFLTLPQFINVNFVPLKFRPLFINIVGLGWSVYLANLVSRSSKIKKDNEIK